MGMKMMIAPLAALALASCGEKSAPVVEEAASLSGGLYELNAEVTELNVTGKGTAGTKLKLGDKQVIKACVSATGKPAPELIGEDGDACQIKNSYIRNGRISAQLSCTRKGIEGQIAPNIDGTFKADSFEARITTDTYLYNAADYHLVQKVMAKRIGECPPEDAAKKAA